MQDRTAEPVSNSLSVVPVSQSHSRVELSAEPVRTRLVSPGNRGRRQGNKHPLLGIKPTVKYYLIPLQLLHLKY